MVKNQKRVDSGLFSAGQRDFIERLINFGELDVSEAAAEMGVTRATIYNYYHSMKNLVFYLISGSK